MSFSRSYSYSHFLSSFLFLVFSLPSLSPILSVSLLPSLSSNFSFIHVSSFLHVPSPFLSLFPLSATSSNLSTVTSSSQSPSRIPSGKERKRKIEIERERHIHAYACVWPTVIYMRGPQIRPRRSQRLRRRRERQLIRRFCSPRLHCMRISTRIQSSPSRFPDPSAISSSSPRFRTSSRLSLSLSSSSSACSVLSDHLFCLVRTPRKRWGESRAVKARL